MFNVEQSVDQYQDVEEEMPSEKVVSPGWLVKFVKDINLTFC